VGGMIHMDARDHGKVIRVDHDVRLRGEMLSSVRHGFRAAYVVIKDEMPCGYKTVGYEAGGPRTGPLKVAIVKARPGPATTIRSSTPRANWCASTAESKRPG
jgi:hypothetical protein